MAFALCGIMLLGLSPQAQNAVLGGFTPNAEVTIAFPKSDYPIGSTAPADISISGEPDGKYTVSITDEDGNEVGSIELEIGGETGSNTGTVNIGLPNEIGEATYTATVTIGDDTATDSATVNLVSDLDWSADPAIEVEEIDANDLRVRPKQSITISIGATDEDTWTKSDGRTGKETDGLRYTWNPGSGTIDEGQGSASIVWTAPEEASASGSPVMVTCTVDDKWSAGETGVGESDTGTRNDDPAEIKSVTITVYPDPCGDWEHESWDEASEIQWTEVGGGIPSPVPPVATEHAVWKDDCAETTKDPKSEIRLYKATSLPRFVPESDGSVYLEVEFQASSKYNGPNTSILKGRKRVNRTWTTGSALTGGGSMSRPAQGAEVQAGESVVIVAPNATDNDTWTRGTYSRVEADGVKYSWTASVGSFTGSTNSPVAHWSAPAADEVPAGSEGLSVTITCTADDNWGENQTGVSPPDLGDRNDGEGVSSTVTFQVVREACGRWLHKEWGEAGTLTWETNSKGDPQPVAPEPIAETLRWEDSCAGTTKPDKTENASYQKIKDEAVEDEGVWYREVEYQAFSAAANGPEAPKVSGRHELPRHWTTPGDLNAGELKVTVTDAPDQKEIAPTTAGQAVVATLPFGGGASFAITGARDTDTYSYWNVPEKGSDDGLRYKWALNGGPDSAPEIDLGSGASASLPSQPALKPGSYTVTCEVDDSSSGGETGVTAPDVGNRNDGPKTHTVVIKIVGTEWEAGQGIGFHPALDEDGQQIEPVEWVEDGQMIAPAADSETKAVPGEVVEFEVAPASDWDAWKREGLGEGIAPDGPLTYKWTASGGKFRVPGANGDFNEVTEASGLKVEWIAPAPDENADNAAGEGESYTITCTIDDGEEARITEPQESGSHDDGALEHETTVEVVPSYWAPTEKGIGFHPTLDENEQPIEPYQWNEDGRITAPIDQRVEDAPKEKIVAPGESVTASVEAAQDWDTLTALEGKSIARDETLTYEWSSGGVGYFLVKDEDGNPVMDADGKPTQAETATGLSVTWVAPDDVQEDTEVELKCTVDDGEGKRAEPHGGTRDDDKLERTVTVKVVLAKVEFEGLARACAGGVAVDGVHDFTITGTAKKSDGTLVSEGTEFKLVFENNKGKNKRATFVPDVTSGQALIPNTNGEEMTVVTDAEGQFDLTVLSSDIISSDVKIKVKRVSEDGKEVEVGEKECEFARVFNLRRFGITGEDGDSGWKFDRALLFEGRGDKSPAKFWIKFQENTEVEIDTNLFEDDGITPKRSDDWDNWLPVNGHRLLVRITEVILLDGTSIEPSRFSDYITLLSDEQGSPIEEVTTFSRADGSSQVWLKSGELITRCKLVTLTAYEMSQFLE